MNGKDSRLINSNFGFLSKKRYIVIEVVFPLIIAAALYLVFRPVDTVIYKIVDLVGGGEFVNFFRSELSLMHFPEWFVYSFPGGLWLLSFQNILTFLNGFTGRRMILLLFLSSFLGVGLEILQAIHITDGRFDWMDVLFYALATGISFSNVWLVKRKWQIYSKSTSSPKSLGVVFLAFTVIIYLADIV